MIRKTRHSRGLRAEAKSRARCLSRLAPNEHRTVALAADLRYKRFLIAARPLLQLLR